MEEITEKWQKDLEKTMNDPKTIELMANNINQAKELFENYAKSFNQNSQSSTNDNNGNIELLELKHRLDTIESRLSNLEKLIAKTS